MLKIVPVQPITFTQTFDSTISLVRDNNTMDIEITVLPKHRFDEHALARQRIVVQVIYESRELRNKKTVQVAKGGCDFDIFTDRDVHLIELYRVAKMVAESLKTYLDDTNLPLLKNDEFPIVPPDVIRAKMLPRLKEINESKSLFKHELN
jgi:hypothetical protein